MVTTNTTDMQAIFERLSQAALIPEAGSDGASCTVNRDDLSSLLLAYRLELGNQNKELPTAELEPTATSKSETDPLTKKWLSDTIDVLTPTADDYDNADYEFFAVKGLDPAKVRLAVSQLPELNCWCLCLYDERDLWFRCGDRTDTPKELDGLPTSWRDDCGKALMHGYESPADWIKAITQQLENKQ